MPNFGDFQLEIYLGGLTGERPALPMGFADLEARAEKAMPTEVHSYVAGGAGNEFTQRANVTAFDRYGLWPRGCCRVQRSAISRSSCSGTSCRRR